MITALPLRLTLGGEVRAWQAMVSVGLGVWQRLQDIFAGFWAPIKAAYARVRDAFAKTLAVDFDLASINDFIRELTGVDLAQVGSDWMAALRSSMQQGWDQLKAWWGVAVLALADVDWLQAGLDWAADLLSGIQQGVISIQGWLQDSVADIAGVDLAQVGSDWMAALRSSMQQGWEQLKQSWGVAVLALADVDWLQAGLDWAADLLTGIQQGWEQLKAWWGAAVLALVDVDWLQAGLDWAADLLTGIQQGWGAIKAWLDASIAELLSFFPDFMLPESFRSDGGERDDSRSAAVVGAGDADAPVRRDDSISDAYRERAAKLTAPAAQSVGVHGRVTVGFDNMPTNMTVRKVESNGPVKLETNTGYSMAVD